ncbi:11673_t:CDS:2, partial [Acaulospora colombiana]
MELSSSSETSCPINKLPFELVTAVASLLDHPADILSLTRSSKRFFQSLTSQHALFVWKAARKAFQPASIPDPPKLFTEYGWVAFIFGPNNCARCQKRTFDLPWSLRLRAHMCKASLVTGLSSRLLNDLLSFFLNKEEPVPPEIASKLRSNCNVPDPRRWICDSLPSLEYGKNLISDLLSDFVPRVYRKKDWDYIISRIVSIVNSEKPVNIEPRLEVTIGILPPFQILMYTTSGLKENREQILLETSVIMKALTNSLTSSDINSQLASKPMQGLIMTELAQWLDIALQQTRQKLGYYDPSNKHGRGKKDSSLVWRPTENKLDPESRVTSWFTCTKCNDVEPRFKRMMVLSFEGVCTHKCKEKHKSVKDRTPWDINNFILNTRAQEAARKMLSLLQIEEESRTSWRVLKRSDEFICNSCPGAMRYMTFADMIRHSQRHETQDIGWMSSDIKEATRISTYRFSYADLASGKYPEEVKKKQFYCVHCTLKNPNPDLRDFNSLRSHIKSKSEDYKFVEDPSLHKNGIEALSEQSSNEDAG